jgi:hypothetical protein
LQVAARQAAPLRFLLHKRVNYQENGFDLRALGLP